MRFFILMLSMSCVILYGYALAGWGGSFVGRGRTDYVAWGLSLGTLCGALAMYLWKKTMHLYFVESEEFAVDGDKDNDDEDDDDEEEEEEEDEDDEDGRGGDDRNRDEDDLQGHGPTFQSGASLPRAGEGR